MKNSCNALRALSSALGAIALLCYVPSARALSVESLGQGILPTGDIVWTVRFTVSKGDEFPWHYHTGSGSAIVVSGVLTEDDGCGTEWIRHTAGTAFAEEAGRVHRAFNEFDEDVVLIWTEIFPSCLTYPVLPGTEFVSGPECEGSSGKSHLVKIPKCP